MFGGKIMNLSREQAISRHRKMWNWIADETKRLKRKIKKYEYFKVMEIDDIPDSKCYCCEFLLNHPNCCANNCIIDWGKNSGCIGSYYGKWIYTDDWQEAARLARIIANLPEREVSD